MTMRRTPVDLLTWYFGRPDSVSGTVLGQVFSAETEDEVFTTFRWASGLSGHLSVSWSDESHRKMTTGISIWGTNGKIFVDRQEIQVYLRDATSAPPEYGRGWTVRYTTELTGEVDFYVRGEEYSAQLDTWVMRIAEQAVSGPADFTEAGVTDEVLFAILNSADGGVRSLDAQASDDDRSAKRTPRLRSRLRMRRRPRAGRRG